MKKYFLKFSVIVLAINLTLSCSSSSSSDGNNTPPVTENFIKFTYNSVNYSLGIPETYNGDKKEIRGGQGINQAYKKISLWMPLNSTTGAHAVTQDPLNANSYEIHFVSQAEGLYLDGISGTINITSITDTVIKGTFECTGLNASDETIAITNGTFQADRNQL
jgi:hypothetical protein